MPITDRSQAIEGGFAQVREALVKFKAKVTDYEWGKWGGELVDEATGKAKPPREFLEINCVDIEVLEYTEELSMDISEKYNFRMNCSDYRGSFWVEKFLESADRFKVLIPDGLVGKIVTWEKVTLEAFDKKGNPTPKYDATNYVIAGVEEAGAPKLKTETSKAESVAPTLADPVALVHNLAIGKTEAELKSAIETHPALEGSLVHPMAKAGVLTQSLIGEGKLALVNGKYQIPA